VDLLGESVPGRRFRVTFDLQDHMTLPAPARIEHTDVLFKRSYDLSTVRSSRASLPVLPLGLNYSAIASEGFGLRRALWARNPRDLVTMAVRHSRWLARVVPLQQSIRACAPRSFEGLPRFDKEPRILLMARLWDPDRNPEQRAERIAINHMRAECVRQLRTAFGPLFAGGLIPGVHARNEYRDCLIADDRLTEKRRYIALVHESSICVATAGLRGSIGWKFAEYVAASKAIVSESTTIRLPGPFGTPSNLLVFRTPQECVDAVRALVDDPERRLEMMRANAAYYHGFVRPDALVWNALTTALLVAAGDATAAQLQRHVG
jgi:hypothetical protein